MKILIVALAVGVVVVGVVIALGSSMEPSDYPDFDAKVSGPLARGARSQMMESRKLWSLPKDTTSAKERQERLVGQVHSGMKFQVLNHHMPRQVLWVHVQVEDDPRLNGWLRSQPDDPVVAKRLN
jgi:hypothetical protein